MAKSRSPRYPSVGLTEAIELAGKLFQAEKRTLVPLELVAKAWKYKSPSGIVRAKVGALRQYGLLNSVKGNLCASDLAVEILVQPQDSEERSEAISRAALNPPLFAEMYNMMPEASNDALKAFLISKKDFAPGSAKQCVDSYRDAMALLESTKTDAAVSAISAPNIVSAQGHSKSISTVSGIGRALRNVSAHGTFGQVPSQDALILRVPFRGTNMLVRIEVADQKLTREHLARVRAYLQMAEDDLDPGSLDQADVANPPETREEALDPL